MVFRGSSPLILARENQGGSIHILSIYGYDIYISTRNFSRFPLHRGGLALTRQVHHQPRDGLGTNGKSAGDGRRDAGKQRAQKHSSS